MTGFSWMIEDQLAGMARPGRAQPLAADLAFLEERGIGLLVSLTETPPNPESVAAHGIELLHLPVRDFTAPSLAQLRTFLRKAQQVIDRGRAVCVHCGAGKGRTGSFLAAYLIGQGMPAARAIAAVRERRPGSVETSEQEQALVALADALTRESGSAPTRDE